MNHQPSPLPNKPWAKLLVNSPDKESILLYNQFYEGQIKTGFQIYQKSPGDAWIRNLSASPIKINDNWLEVNEEREISSGEKVSFKKYKDSDDENFDYVFVIMTSQSQSPNGGERKEVPEPSMIVSPPLTNLCNELQQTLTCSICTKILRKCATLDLVNTRSAVFVSFLISELQLNVLTAELTQNLFEKTVFSIIFQKCRDPKKI